MTMTTEQAPNIQVEKVLKGTQNNLGSAQQSTVYSLEDSAGKSKSNDVVA